MIPDPLELLESRIEKNIDLYKEGHCMFCDKDVGENNLISYDENPDSPFVCFDCLSPESQKAYTSFINKLT